MVVFVLTNCALSPRESLSSLLEVLQVKEHQLMPVWQVLFLKEIGSLQLWQIDLRANRA